MIIATDEIIAAAPAYNEAEVRFRIIDPLIRKLGYADGDDVYIKLEEKLEYPYYFIGHKNKKRDLPLGFPDYRAGLKGARGSFIVEAKSATVEISKSDIEQGHSYAAHAEVNAHYFVICNGLEIRVYETLLGPGREPIVQLSLKEIDGRFHELENVLAPVSLARHCRTTYDLKLKLGEGLPSAVTIRSGIYTMAAWEYRVFVNDVDQTAIYKNNLAAVDENLAILQREFELKVADGSVKRAEDGRISASLTFSGATKNNQESMRLLGIDRMDFSTSEQFLSFDPDTPTVFESTSDFQVAKGTKLPPLFGPAVPMDMDVDVDVFIKTRMFIQNDNVLGDYLALADYNIEFPGFGKIRFELDLIGSADLKLII